MKLLLVFISALLLVACGPEQKLADTPPAPEKKSEVWLYDNQFCNAHVYFYENDNSDLHVEYIETSEEKNLMDLEGQRADFCISTFLKD